MANNRLSRIQTRALEDWFRDNLPLIKRANWSKEQVSQHATSKLGFPITIGNLRLVSKLWGYTFPNTTTRRGSFLGIPRDAVMETIRLTALLAGEFGHPIPPIIQEVLNRPIQDESTHSSQ